MQVHIQGSGGVRGWPEPGCRCASCQRARAGGTGRAAFGVIVDGSLRACRLGGRPGGRRTRAAHGNLPGIRSGGCPAGGT